MHILYDPEPRRSAEIFAPEDLKRFLSGYRITPYEGGDRGAFYSQHLPTADIVVSQQPLDASAIASAPQLKAIFNVETNFLPNIDYAACFRRGIHVLAPSSVFAVPVAEMGLGMALSLARDIHTGHGDFLVGRERYGLEGNENAELLSGANVGLIGFGDIGRHLHRLLAGFRCNISVFDPWLPDGFIERRGARPTQIEDVLSNSRFVFVVAAVTADNRYLLDDEKISLLQSGSMLVLLSRAAVVDFAALAQAARSGRIRVATDVFPEEPVAASDPLRSVPNILFSSHRAGALRDTMRSIGRLMLEDLDLIARGLPPVSCKRAERETVMRMRSKPVERT